LCNSKNEFPQSVTFLFSSKQEEHFNGSQTVWNLKMVYNLPLDLFWAYTFFDGR